MKQGPKRPVTFVEIEGYEGLVLLCMACGETYLDGFGHIDPRTFIEARTDPGSEISENFAEARSTKAGTPKAFAEESLHTNRTFYMSVERKVQIMSAKEWQSELGRPALAKDTRHLPSMNIMTEDGANTEQVWVFAMDSTKPHLRTLTVGYLTQAVRQAELMNTKQHLYSSQAQDVFEFHSNSIKTEANCEVLRGSLKTVSSLQKDALDTKPASPAKPLAPAAAPSRPAASEFSGQQVASSPPVEKPVAEAAPSGRLLLPAAPAASGSGPSSLPAEPSPVIKRAPSVRGGWGTQSVASSGFDDAEGDSIAKRKGRGFLADAAGEVHKWVSRLDLESVMQGLRGSQMHHARDAETKLRSRGEDSEARRLRAHLKLCSLAEAIQPKSMGKLEADELRAALNSLEGKVTFTPEVTEALVRRAAVAMSAAVVDIPAFEKLLKIVYPWRLPEEEDHSFNVFDPRCALLPGHMDAKMLIFNEFIVKGVLCELIKQGEDKSNLVLDIVQLLQTRMESIAGDEVDMDDKESGFICELITVCIAAGTCLATDKLLLHTDVENRLNEISSFRGFGALDGASCGQPVALACEESPFYDGIFSYILKRKAALLEASAMVKGLVDTMDTLPGLGCSDSCTAMLEVLGKVPQVMCAVDEQYMKGFSARVQAAIQTIHDASVGKKDTMVEQETSDLTRLLSEATTTFPFDANINEWLVDWGQHLASLTDKATLDKSEAVIDRVIGADACSIEDLPLLKERVEEMKGRQLTDNIHSKLVQLAKVICRGAMQKLEQMAVQAEGYLTVLADTIAFIPHNMNIEERGLIEILQKASALVNTRSAFDEKVMKGDEMDRDKLLKEEAAASEVLAKTAELRDLVGSIVPGAGQEQTRLVHKCVDDLVTKHTELLQQIGNIFVSQSVAHCKEIQEEVLPLQGGIEGANWLDGLEAKDKKDWKKVLAHANATILKEKKVALLKPTLDNLAKASCKKTPKGTPNHIQIKSRGALNFDFRAVCASRHLQPSLGSTPLDAHTSIV